MSEKMTHPKPLVPTHYVLNMLAQTQGRPMTANDVRVSANEGQLDGVFVYTLIVDLVRQGLVIRNRQSSVSYFTLTEDGHKVAQLISAGHPRFEEKHVDELLAIARNKFT